MIKDRVELDLPDYDGLLAGLHHKESGHTSRRATGTDDWLLLATLSGLGRINTRVGDLALGPGTLTLVSPGVPHDYGTAKGAVGWEILWVHFHPVHVWLELLSWPTLTPGIAVIEPTKTQWKPVEQSFREVFRLSVQPVRRRRQFAMNALERLLLQCDALVPETGTAMDDRVRQVVEHIRNRLSEPLTLKDLSSLVHLSPSRFSHLFRAETGLSPLQYVFVQRIQRAKTLLDRTTLTVGEIAAEIGMEPFHFSARFKAETGVSPRNYRTSLSR